MPTNLELERMIRDLIERVQTLEECHVHQMSGLNHVGIPTKIKNGRFVDLRAPLRPADNPPINPNPALREVLP